MRAAGVAWCRRLKRILTFATDATQEDPRQNVAVFNAAGDLLATGGTDGIVNVYRVTRGGGSARAHWPLENCQQE